MKKNKVLKITVILLLIIIVSLVSLVGIYTKKGYKFDNLVKDYVLGMDLKGGRLVQLTVKKEDVTPKTGEKTENITAENQLETNKEEAYTKENYQIAKKIIKSRLEDYTVKENKIGVNNETGAITIQMPENARTDTVLETLILSGKFEIIDSETKELLLNNNDIEKAQAAYSNQEAGTVAYVNIKFNKEGAKKLEQISRTYVKSEEAKTEENVIAENSTTLENTVEENKTEEASKTTEKKVTLKFSGEEYITTYFSEPMTTGTLQLTIGSATKDNATLQEYLKNASSIAALINNGELPIQYTISQNQYISSEITDNIKALGIILVIIIITIMMIFMIIKYKAKGILASFSLLGFISLILLIARYVDIIITVNSIIGIALGVLLSFAFLISLMSNIKKANNDEEITVRKAIKEVIIRYIMILIPVSIMVIVFSFVLSLELSSFGITLFWVILLFIAHNILITRAIFVNYEDLLEGEN